MCGVVGYWSLASAELPAKAFEHFVDSVRHRGPDGRGVYVDQNAGLRLGHRRLAILDVSGAGLQPMSYADGRFWVAFNGEIYNFLELRSELEGLGCRFRTQTDTEVIAAAYAQWGDRCQARFNGMWAIALWDAARQELFLSRDRFGVKPLLYLHHGGRFAFASELKAFLALEGFECKFDGEVIRQALESPNSVEASERTILQGVWRLPAGHSMLVRRDGTAVKSRWWNTLDHIEAPPASRSDRIERFLELFEEACRIRMRSDVPIGTALSGGLDSSSVICTMARLRAAGSAGERTAADWQRAFVATYPGTVQDEAEHAMEVIRHCGATPVLREVSADDVLRHLDEVLFQMEESFEPAVGPWLIYREFRRHGVVVSLDGHGGDELLGGYHHHPAFAEVSALFPRPSLSRFLDARRAHRNMLGPGRARERWGLDRRTLVAAAQSYPPVRAAAGMLGSFAHARVGTDGPSAPASSDELKHMDPLTRRLYREFHHTTLPTILRNFDRCSMAHGIEVRAPLLDWRLVCYGFSLPATEKVGGGYTKRILRDAMRGVIPESIRTRTAKLGFSSPTEEWLGRGLSSILLDTARSRAFLEAPFWSGRTIAQELEKAARIGDLAAAHRAWPYIQASRLMDLLGAHRAVA